MSPPLRACVTYHAAALKLRHNALLSKISQPLLRVALSTWILVDGDIVITDVARQRADYAAMGMRPADGSLHYVQADGYIHAVDLRTRGRSEVKNRLVQLYFWSVGLGTLRHVGT